MARADLSYLFGCITTIVVTLARITLFIGCGCVAIYVIGSTFDQGNELLGIDSIKEPGQVMGVFVAQGFFLGNCIMGMIGSYTRDPGHLAMFALVPTAAEFMTAFGTARRYVNRGSGAEFINFRSKLEDARPKYLWDTTDTPKNEATKLWDSVQESMKCCGLENMYDWNQWRPEGVDNNTMPVSCCFEKDLTPLPERVCHYDQAFRMGCLDKHEDISIFNLINAMIPMILILCIPVNLAFIIYKRKKAPASEIKDVPEIYPRL